MSDKTNEPRVIKYRCIECRLIHYDTGKKDGITCKCGGKLDPLGWVDLTTLDKSDITKGTVMSMIRVQTTLSMGEHYIERVLEVDDIGTLSEDERAAIIDGAIAPVEYDHEDTGPDVQAFDQEKSEPQSKEASDVGNIKIKIEVDTSEIQAALKDVELLTHGLCELEGKGGIEDKLAYLDRLITLTHAFGGNNPLLELGGRVQTVLDSVQGDLGLKER
ncbi:hypothetical protein [Paenibacillus sp. FSL R7-0333]|uniref:hypothetical protein n=1 Tax=Paenibacillus sp. FSL R7-0333 TaxID=1926587 RepID=UPI00096DC589|nr:hypothetical protein BK146_16585 [Paenibacillus sp. FSL R7-0333]